MKRAALSLLLTYLLGCIVAGILLAEMTIHVPPYPVGNEAQFRSRVQQEFNATFNDVSITAADGVRLKAWYVRPPNANGESVILLHGIGDNRSGIAGFGDNFLRHGYSILIPDSRAHGDSGGRLLTYGVLERDDVHRWVTWLRTRDPHCTYLLGESMGAAIGLQATAVTPQLCAVAVESPFATFRAVGYERMGWMTHLGTLFWKTLGRPVIESAIVYTRLRYGIYLPNANPEYAVEHSRVPSLLIAGTADRNIPMRNAQELQRNCSSHCALWIVPGADHGGATNVAPTEFRDRILAWFQHHDEPTAP